ncbi:hypothetical protein NDU88_004180 [Pleurodeles waltl]|uniref:Uncharacterized protein n=1 Tax=Pleurodeles waltl TaxID=8319 RepID=A0AAV7QDT4_PLEWA|nr:hypothetical protein NDU88_004180 [Pleurodeles waltl]
MLRRPPDAEASPCSGGDAGNIWLCNMCPRVSLREPAARDRRVTARAPGVMNPKCETNGLSRYLPDVSCQ